MVFNNSLIAPADVLCRTQKPDVTLFQDVLFIGRKLPAFAFAHAENLKKFPEDVPPKVLTT